jgi:hypothetical protein
MQIEIVAMAVATAIQESKKFATTEHACALAYVIAESAPAELAANVQRIGNVSEIRQDMEKSGLCLKKPHEDSALARNVRSSLIQIQAIATAKSSSE